MKAEYEVEVNLRLTDSRLVCLGVGHPSGTPHQFFFLLEIFFKLLRVCYFVAPSLTRRRVCNLLVQLLLGLARAVSLVSKSRRTHGHILLSHLRLPQPGGPGPCVYIPQEQGGLVIPLGSGVPFVASYDSQSYVGCILTSLHTGQAVYVYGLLTLTFSAKSLYLLGPEEWSHLFRQRNRFIPMELLMLLVNT
jgi:hypothetical protein